MFTQGSRQTKYIYPSLLILFLLMLLWHLGIVHAGEATTETGTGVEAVQPLYGFAGDADDSGHYETDLIAAVDRFNEMMMSKPGGMNYGLFQDDRHDLVSSLSLFRDGNALPGENSGDAVSGYYSEAAEGEAGDASGLIDNRYDRERRELTDRRNREADAYQDNRRRLESRLSSTSQISPNRSRLEQALNDLDRRHAERERAYERDFRNMDADFAVARW